MKLYKKEWDDIMLLEHEGCVYPLNDRDDLFYTLVHILSSGTEAEIVTLNSSGEKSMNKTWTRQEYEFALDSAWSAFFHTMQAHGATEEEIAKAKESVYFKEAYGYTMDCLGLNVAWFCKEEE